MGHLCWLNLLKTLIDFIILYNSKKNPYIFYFLTFLSYHFMYTCIIILWQYHWQFPSLKSSISFYLYSLAKALYLSFFKRKILHFVFHSPNNLSCYYFSDNIMQLIFQFCSMFLDNVATFHCIPLFCVVATPRNLLVFFYRWMKYYCSDFLYRVKEILDAVSFTF